MHVRALLLVQIAGETVNQHLREADNRVERRSQFVRDDGHELRLVLIGLMETVFELFDFLQIEPRDVSEFEIVKGDGGRAREEVCETLLVYAGFDDGGGKCDEHAEDFAYRPDDRSRPRATQSRPARGGIEVCEARFTGEVCDDADTTLGGQPADGRTERDALRVTFENPCREMFGSGEP